MAKSKKGPTAGSKGSSGPEDEGFDLRMARLEELVSDLEGGELNLEEAMERFGEGVELLARCREALSAYEVKVEELSSEAQAGLEDLRDEDPEE